MNALINHLQSITNLTLPYTDYLLDLLPIEAMDLIYLQWLIWLIYPFVISILLPLCLVLWLYGSALFLFIYQHRNRVKDAYSEDFWKGARCSLAAIWEAQSKIWHGYEIVGLDKLPETGPAILIFYHGTIPLDFYYMLCNLILKKDRIMYTVGDKFVFQTPGWRTMMEVFCVIPGTVASCSKILNEGNILAISPGGLREAMFADQYYNTVWGKRTGFAKIALQTKAPIYPIFTQNCREAFRTYGKRLLRRLYERTRLPLIILLGWFPVKLRTYVGDPIIADSSQTPEEVAELVQSRIRDMINEKQRIPGTILGGIWDRFF